MSSKAVLGYLQRPSVYFLHVQVNNNINFSYQWKSPTAT